LAIHLEDQITALPDKLFLGTNREVDGEGDRVTAGGKTDHTIQSKGLSWHQLEHPSRDIGDWEDFVGGLCRDGIMIKDFISERSDNEERYLNQSEVLNFLQHVSTICI